MSSTPQDSTVPTTNRTAGSADDTSSLLTVFRHTASTRPNEPVLGYFDQVLDAAEVDRRTDALAAALYDAGLVAGDRVVLYLQNNPQYLVSLLAIWKIGAIAVAANPMLKQRELRLILDDSEAKALICLEQLHRDSGAEAVRDSTVRLVVTTSEVDDITNSLPAHLTGERRGTPAGAHDLATLVAAFDGHTISTHAPGYDDVAVITYTSGTTGRPKGACNTHGNILLGGCAYRDWFNLRRPGAVLGIAPLFHVTGLSGHIGAALVSGLPLLLSHRFDPQVVLEQIRRDRPTFTVGAITALMALCRAADDPRTTFESFTAIASGGAPIAPTIVTEFESRTGHYVHNAYGMTETTSPTHAVPLGRRAPTDPASGALSVGFPVPDCTTRILDGHGHEQPTGEVGELVVSGSRIVPGYWNKPEETAAAIQKGWLHTGDMGFVDTEGWFYVVDRKKDVIVVGGYKVWPREVEDVLLSHPAIAEVGVIGVPDDYRGETVKAVVSLRPDAPDRPSSQDLIVWSKARMAAYKYPRLVEIVDDLPKTATGKIMRRELRDS